MFHVKPAAQGVLLGALLSGAAAFAQSGGGEASSAAASEAPTKESGGAAGKTSTASRPAKRDPRIVGLGRSCQKRSDCSSRSQVCLKQQDNRGKALPRGFCALPCARIEQGLTRARPGAPARDAQTSDKASKKPLPPRCPPPYKCRSKGGDISIDLCVRE